MQLVVLDPAIADVQSIWAWYNQQQNGLEKNFIQKYYQALRATELFPYSCSLRDSQLRVKLLRKFLYAIYYALN